MMYPRDVREEEAAVYMLPGVSRYGTAVQLRFAELITDLEPS
jgi:hypothetical protein